jgi:hypothetical protein
VESLIFDTCPLSMVLEKAETGGMRPIGLALKKRKNLF